MNFLNVADKARLRAISGEDFVTTDRKQKDNEKIQEKTRIKKEMYSSRRSRAFENDYPTFLLSLASSVRTGLDPLAAIKTVAQMLPQGSALKEELLKLDQRLESGDSEESAILSFGQTIGHPDVALLTTSLLLARKQGSSLGACLQRLNKVTRQRQSFRRKAKAAVAMQRLSSFGIAGCSLVIGGMQIGMNPEAFVKSWNHPLGGMLIGSGILLMFLGTVWMLFIGRARV